MRESDDKRTERVFEGCLANALGGVAASFVVRLFQLVGVAASYVYSFNFFGIPMRHFIYGGIVALVLCCAVVSPILSNWALGLTAGYDQEAQNRYMARYWLGTMATLSFLTIVGSILSFYFETEVVFQ